MPIPSETPLSDTITRLIEDSNEGTYDQFCAKFLESQVGVIALGAPTGTIGRYLSQGEMALGSTSSPEGERMILVCADPVVFMKRFGGPFNAGMDGESVAKTALASPECAGIHVNSAASTNTIIIRREVLVRLFGKPKQNSTAKPWWKFW